MGDWNCVPVALGNMSEEEGKWRPRGWAERIDEELGGGNWGLAGWARKLGTRNWGMG